jgi:hypothetical protein
MTWGGRRRGAGAKPGNTNALKHGRCSGQIRRAARKIVADDDIRTVLLLLTRLSHTTEGRRYREAFTSQLRAFQARKERQARNERAKLASRKPRRQPSS